MFNSPDKRLQVRFNQRTATSNEQQVSRMKTEILYGINPVFLKPLRRIEEKFSKFILQKIKLPDVLQKL